MLDEIPDQMMRALEALDDEQLARGIAATTRILAERQADMVERPRRAE